ncbi:MAG: hypothetical protein ACKV19_10365 [Verrucomicrobiales bacterium]
MTRPSRRFFVVWGLRLLLGVALGFGLRMLYERRPVVRFAAGMAVRSLRDEGGGVTARGSHIKHGQPHFFSLNQIMRAADPAAELRAWREAFQNAPQDVQQRVLQARAEVSVSALRQLLLRLSRDTGLRDELGHLFTLARDLGADLQDADTAARSLVELARLDPGLALDGAQAADQPDAVRMIWAIIAEDNPEHVIELVRSGQAPEEALSMVIASLAANDLAKADALLRSLPDEKMDQAVTAMADALARTRPLEAIAMGAGPEGAPDRDWAALVIGQVPGPLAADFLLALERQHPELVKSCGHEIGIVLQREAQREPGFVLEWLDRQPVDAGGVSHATGLALATAAGHDPARAAELMARWPGHLGLSSAQERAVAAWMSQDPTAAAAWIADQPKPSRWLAGHDWAAGVPPAQSPDLARWIETTARTPDGQLPVAAAGLVSPWIQHDPAGAVTWVQSLPEGSTRCQAVAEAIRALTGADGGVARPEPLVDSLVRSCPEALGAVVNGVDPRQFPFPEKVVEALPQLMEGALGEVRPDRIAAHLASTVRNSEQRATTLEAVAALPNPELRQALLDHLAGQLSNSDLDLARDLAAVMPNSDSANQLVERHFRRRFR